MCIYCVFKMFLERKINHAATTKKTPQKTAYLSGIPQRATASSVFFLAKAKHCVGKCTTRNHFTVESIILSLTSKLFTQMG